MTINSENYPAEYKLYDLNKFSLISKLMELPHKYISKKYSDFNGDVLEFGSGNGANINYFKSFKTYTFSDIQFKNFDKKHLNISKTKKIYFDLEKSDFGIINQKYDLFLLFHTLEHIQSPHEVLKNIYNALKPNGIIELIQPIDPSLSWNLGELFGSIKSPVDKKTYYYHQAREHINSIKNLDRIINFYFNKVDVTYFPINSKFFPFNLIKSYTIKK